MKSNLPFRHTNIQGVDRYENTLRLHRDASIEITSGNIRLYTYELNEKEHNIDIKDTVIIRNQSQRVHYIELAENSIAPYSVPYNPSCQTGPKEYIITNERPSC